MITNEILNKLSKKINDDFKEYTKGLSRNYILNHIYDIYHADNFVYNMEYIMNEIDLDDEDGFCYGYCYLEDKTLENMLNFKDNIVSYYVQHRYDIRHSERYNLENIDDFSSVVNCIMQNIEN